MVDGRRSEGVLVLAEIWLLEGETRQCLKATGKLPEESE